MSGINTRGVELTRRARAGDRAARDTLVVELLPLARRLARRYAHGPESIDDLQQVASLGVIKAVDRYDPDRGTPLSRFATRYIEGELKHHLRDNLGVPHVPRAKRSTAGQASRVATRLTGELGRPPRPEEIGARMNMGPAEIRDALAVAAALRRPRSLEEARAGGLEVLADSIGDVDAGLDLVADRQLLARVLAALPRSDRVLVFLRIVAELPPGVVAERLGCSSRHAARLLGRALRRAHDVARAQGSTVAVEPHEKD
jgi:RNA polymerase sigma-B factor